MVLPSVATTVQRLLFSATRASLLAGAIYRPQSGSKMTSGFFEEAAQLGFFHYGPRLWMVGEVEPLKDLQDELKVANHQARNEGIPRKDT